MALPETVDEAARIMGICNACRYCEGYCPVFPAMERRLSFTQADLAYLANLCHQCQACHYACQYAPPHEFAVNVPQSFAVLRRETYADHVWPSFLAPLIARNGLWVALASAGSIAAFLIAAALAVDPAVLFAAHGGPGAFYAVIPHGAMIAVFGAVSLYVAAAIVAGSVKFWRATGRGGGGPVAGADVLAGLGDALTLRHLGGDGAGCNYPDERASGARRVFHQATFWGFLLCFAATCAGTVYHYGLGWQAPYGFASMPVLFGTVGGAGLIVGPAGLMWLRRSADPEPQDPGGRAMDDGFLALLFLVSLTGLALLALRETAAMGTLLAVHLGSVLALFLTLPYGKFMHAPYRLIALTRAAAEGRRERAGG